MSFRQLPSEFGYKQYDDEESDGKMVPPVFFTLVIHSLFVVSVPTSSSEKQQQQHSSTVDKEAQRVIDPVVSESRGAAWRIQWTVHVTMILLFFIWLL